MLGSKRTPLIGYSSSVQRNLDNSVGTATKTFGQVMKSLFANNEQGFALDFYDTNVLFQGASGTTPVTGAGQPMGLVLDKSKGLALSAEKLTNGDFSSGGTGWNYTSGVWTFVDGVARKAPMAQFADLTQIPAVANKWYKVTYTISRYVSGTHYAKCGGSVANTNTGAGTFTSYVLAANSTGIGLGASQISDFDLDYISIVESYGNHAYQTTSSMRPILRDNPRRADYDGVDDKLLVNLPSTLTNCTVVRATAFAGVEVDTGVTITSPVTLNTDACAMLVINRALTAKELSDVKIAFEQLLRVSLTKYLIQSMFANGEVGFAYDINDLSTLFQDAAGTTPVTAAGQPVGLVLDKSKSLQRGNELVINGGFDVPDGWIITGGFTIAGGKLRSNAATNNLINRTDFSAVLGKRYEVTVNISSYTRGVPRVSFGGGIVDMPLKAGIHTYFVTATATTSNLYIYAGYNGVGGVWEMDYISIKEIAGNHAYQATSASRPILRQTPILGSELVVNGDFSNGTTGFYPKNIVTLEIVDGALKVTNNDVYFGFAEVSFPTTIGKQYLLRADTIASSGAGAAFHIASVTNSNDIANNLDSTSMAKGVLITAKSATTYISLKVPTNVVGSWRIFDNVSAKEVLGYSTNQNYLEFDGVDDFLQTSAIDFTATDKVSLFAGVRKLSTVEGMVLELSSNVSTNNGSFYLAAPAGQTNPNQILFSNKGTLFTSAQNPNLSPPISVVVSCKGDIAADSTIIRTNGTQFSSGTDLGTGNYGNYPLYIGRRGGTSLPFNGHLYSLIGVGRLTTDFETSQLEQALSKTVGVNF